MVQSEGVVGAQLLHDQAYTAGELFGQCLSRGGKSHVSSTPVSRRRQHWKADNLIDVLDVQQVEDTSSWFVKDGCATFEP